MTNTMSIAERVEAICNTLEGHLDHTGDNLIAALRAIATDLRAQVGELAHFKATHKMGAERYWEGRWRDEVAENAALRDALEKIANRFDYAEHSGSVEHRTRQDALLALSTKQECPSCGSGMLLSRCSDCPRITSPDNAHQKGTET
jgi:hypothetical protein